jgi:hypothetical protein
LSTLETRETIMIIEVFELDPSRSVHVERFVHARDYYRRETMMIIEVFELDPSRSVNVERFVHVRD